MGKHTVEKIGGTSMSEFGDVLKNIIIGKRTGKELYNRIFVVSAYGGITDLLLEHKKTSTPGIYAKFAAGDKSWEASLDEVKQKMTTLNAKFANIGLDLEKANEFVVERLEGIRSCLKDLMKLRSFGHLRPSDYLPATRELLSAVGEAHSAFNSVNILQNMGINAVFVDLTGWKEEEVKTFDEEIKSAFKNIDYSTTLPIATGYVKCAEGIMKTFDRGYSDITFSRIAVITGAAEGIIHKEFHLSTGDPKLIGVDKVKTIGATNFDIADQLADLGMEAIHSKASKRMEAANIPIRVKNTFDPEDQGTLISRDYVSPTPRVEMICGRKDILGIEVFDSDMVGQSGYDYRLLRHFAEANISYIAKNTNANTITHYIPEKSPELEKCIQGIKKEFDSISIDIRKVAIVSVIGSNMKLPGFLYRAAKALAEANVNVLALDQCMRQVNMQFIISREDFEKAQRVLHAELVEKVKN